MQKLTEQLASVDPADEYASACIYSYIEENILPHVDADTCPPPNVLIYAALRLIEPTLSCDDIPTLLELLANIEAVRLRAVEQARAALKLQQKFAESQERGVQLLKKSEEKRIRSIADEELDESTRLLLREDVMLNLCRLHICYLWTSPESHTIAKVMRKYFPSNYAREGDPFADERWRGLLHHGLTHAERESVHAAGEDMKIFLSRARVWDLERKTYFEKLGLKEEVIFGENEFLSYSRDFDAKFRSSIDEKGMMKGLSVYLKEVQRMVNVLEKLFPSAQQKAADAAATLLAREAKRMEREARAQGNKVKRRLAERSRRSKNYRKAPVPRRKIIEAEEEPQMQEGESGNEG